MPVSRFSRLPGMPERTYRDPDEYVLGQVPAPIAVVTDNGPCFRGGIDAEVFRGEDPLLRYVRTRVRSPQTNGVVERFFGSPKYEHLHRVQEIRRSRPETVTLSDRSQPAYQKVLERHLGGGVGSGQRCS
jgi:transposase InsO family protein